MTTRLLRITRLGGAALALSLAHVTAPAQAIAPGADEEFARLEIRINAVREAASRAAVAPDPIPLEERRINRDAMLRGIADAGFQFLQDRPADRRRPQVILWLLQHSPYFVKRPTPTGDSTVLIRDESAAAVWDARMERGIEELEHTAALTPEQERSRAMLLFTWFLRQANARIQKKEAVSWDDLRQRLQARIAFCATPEESVAVTKTYFYMAEKALSPDQLSAEFTHFTGSSREEVRQMAETKLRGLALMSRPVELKFTALDGREIDLTKLRGKVVLLDFWATWCEPCLRELPKVKRVYQAYHEQGFEVIGVSCDYAPDLSGPPAKAARTATEVLAFTRAENMPWPQHYSGKKHNLGGNPLAQQFGVTGIPATFLIDCNGMIAATNLKGDQLDAKVKELLAK